MIGSISLETNPNSSSVKSVVSLGTIGAVPTILDIRAWICGWHIKSINSCYLQDGDSCETKEFAKLFETDNFKEGVAAFFEKRRANFSWWVK